MNLVVKFFHFLFSMSETLSVCKGVRPTVFEGASKTADELRTTLQKLEIAVNKVSGNILRVKKDMDALQNNPEIKDAFIDCRSSFRVSS